MPEKEKKKENNELSEIKNQILELRKELEHKKPIPNVRQFFAPARNEQAELTKKLLTSDEDNYTKARTPSAFAMTTFDLMGPWLSGKHKSLNDLLAPDPPQPNHVTFCNQYRVNSIALRGQSRDEYVSVMQPIGLNADMLQFRMSEKAKLKEGSRK